jgi:DNA polymerase elongation subunit (family B)
MLIFDIETQTFGKPNPKKDVFKYMGAYSYIDKKYYFLDDKDEVKELLKRHKIIVGFNSYHYDEPIMKRCGCWVGGHTHLDLYKIIKKRSNLLRCENESKSLRNLAKFFGMKVQKGEMDYELLNKPAISQEEFYTIKEYTLKDIEVTKELFEYIYNFFEPFKEYLSKYDQDRFKWLTTSTGAYAYKVICNMTGIEEEYSDIREGERYKGGYVSLPTQAEEHDDILCYDFNSLYPHCFIQANLYSHSCNCCKEEDKWTGNEMFPVTGKYCIKTQGKIEKLLLEMYKKRQVYKKDNDRREYVIKIIINTMYGISGSPLFKNLYSYKTASDCTLIARRSTKFARKKFQSAGYEVLYSDTDSVYLKDPFKDPERLKFIKKHIVDTIKKNLPFPAETFDMGVDDEIKHIWFFKKNDKFLKKFYIYVTEGGKVKVKGLPMIKNDSSKVGYHVFKKYMLESVKQGVIKFDYENVKLWVDNELRLNLDYVVRTYKVNSFETYKNESQLQAQISKKYGAGVHYLIANKKVGVGKGCRYCTREEFKDAELGFDDLVLTKFWSEMEVFCDIPVIKKYKVVGRKQRRKKAQLSLEAWCDLGE